MRLTEFKSSPSCSELRKHVESLKALSAASATDSESTRRAMAAYTKLSNERFDHMHAAMVAQQTQLETIYRQVVAVSKAQPLEYNAIAIAMRHIAGYVTLHETISSLRNDVHELVRGRLPPHLIDAGTIQRVIQGIFFQTMNYRSKVFHSVIQKLLMFMRIQISILHDTSTTYLLGLDSHIQNTQK